jgi:hypothetical protein
VIHYLPGGDDGKQWLLTVSNYWTSSGWWGRLDPHHVDLRVGIGLGDDAAGRLDLALLTT